MKNLIIFFIIILSTCAVYADFTVPLYDEVYGYLQSMEILGKIPSIAVYPSYYDRIQNYLSDIVDKQDIPKSYKGLNNKYLSFMKLDNEDGLHSEVFPLKELPWNILKPNSIAESRSSFISYKNNDLNLFSSFILGIEYDIKNNDEQQHRTYQYYGLEFGGNFQKNLGLYTRYRKGNYTGDYNFIHEDPYIHQSGGMDRKVTVYSEFDFKNPILNLSIGYSNFEIGKNITSSVILNGMTNPFGYFKYYKKIGKFHFMAFNSQLTTDSVTVSSEFPIKSFSLQTLYYQDDRFLLGIGQSVIYGNKTIDLAYWTPLMVFKLIDFKNHNRDNEFVFAYSTWRPVDGLMHYFNFFMDDLMKSQLLTKDWLTNFALQSGLMYQFSSLPLRLSAECTAVGPVTYTHRDYELVYSQDNMLLGYLYGANLLNLAFQINYMNPFFTTEIQYENMQQGSNGSNPFSCETEPVEFLSGEFTRTQRISGKISFYLNQHLRAKVQYTLINRNNITTNYLFSGLEFQF
ncbi:hypothetical protein D4R71_01360 [bacterium]|nr:MAG: hypothetical protein D4R71_01360 [bacterium]